MMTSGYSISMRRTRNATSKSVRSLPAALVYLGEHTRTVQQTTKLQSQCQLLCVLRYASRPTPALSAHSPRQLDLPSADELLVLDNLDVLKTNGFEVSVDEDAAAGSRISLVAHPTSKATIFGVSGASNAVIYHVRS